METQSQRIMLPRIDAAPGDPFGRVFEQPGSNCGLLNKAVLASVLHAASSELRPKSPQRFVQPA